MNIEHVEEWAMTETEFKILLSSLIRAYPPLAKTISLRLDKRMILATANIALSKAIEQGIIEVQSTLDGYLDYSEETPKLSLKIVIKGW